MWKLKSVYINNIVSFKEAKLDIEQGVATLIFGHNEDNASQPCNGSGKSSLIEAISFALTGEQLRKVKTIDEIINDHADTAYVALELENDYDNTRFVIERTISRSAPQVIQCMKYDSDGNEIESDKTVQATVADYNKFILSEIGLTKDDIYNNYILCDNKYESFFDCSDKNKKEVINRFSNGVLIDESIERVHQDMVPVEERLNKANSKVINIKGSISAIEAELDQVGQKKADAKAQRIERIAKIDESIDKCRSDIEEAKSKQEKGEKRLETLKNVQETVKELEDSDMGLIDAYRKVKQLCEDNDLDNITDYEQQSIQYKDKVSETKEKIRSLKKKVTDIQKTVDDCKSDYEKHLKQYNANVESNDKKSESDKQKIAKLNEDISKLDEKLDKIEADIKSNKKQVSALEEKSDGIMKVLRGSITCPKCGHEFLLDNDKTIDELNDEVNKIKNDIADKNKGIDKLNSEFDDVDAEAVKKSDEIEKIEKELKDRRKTLDNEYSDVSAFKRKFDSASSDLASINKSLTEAHTDLDRYNGKLEVMRNRLFGEITGILEGRILNGEGFVSQQKSSIQFYEGQLKQHQQSKKELIDAPEADFETSLQESLKKYSAELRDAEDDAASIQKEFDTLKGQETYFTMFKSYIARKKIDALSLIVNDFLEKIGSDIRLKLEGFTVTKTGKLRDKISVQVMRDGIDCGSYHKFSGGEKARLNLACILSLHTLTNSNCEAGKGLDFIIIDELLDKSDEMGMTTYCDALNKLKQTALLITQGAVSEGYPHKLLITKRQGISTISK